MYVGQITNQTFCLELTDEHDSYRNVGGNLCSETNDIRFVGNEQS
jgi:hypothetical protein